MGFFKQLFTPPQPCDVCCLGLAKWLQEQTGVIDWSITCDGLSATLLICRHCASVLASTGTAHKTPILLLSVLVSKGVARRPATHVYLEHEQWRRIWLHTLDSAGIRPADQFAALAAIRGIEEQFLATVQS
jgi:hypothetical protein